MEIAGFKRYTICEASKTIIDKTNNKVMVKNLRPDRSAFGYYKLQDDAGVWRQISERKIEALLNPPNPPAGYKKVPTFNNVFISTKGQVWTGPSLPRPLGGLVKPSYREGRYPIVEVENRVKEVHQLMALTYLDEFYLEKGLCVMHLDDNKNNFDLSNLKIATYSENNKAAYDTGVNPGNGLKK